MPITSVAEGGTGQGFLAANYVLAGNDTSEVLGIAPGATNTVMVGNGTSELPGFRALTADDLPVIPVTHGGTGFDFLAPKYILAGNGTSSVLGIAPGAVNTVLVGNGTSELPGFRGIIADDLPVIPVSNGGTGYNSLAANYILAGNDTSPVQGIRPEAAGTVLTSNGMSSLPTFQQITAPNIDYTFGSALAVTRKVNSRLRDRADILDWGATPSTATLNNAVMDLMATTGGSLWMTNGNYSVGSVDLPANYGGVALRYDGPKVPVTLFGETPRGSRHFGQTALVFMDNEEHAGVSHSAHHIESHPVGTGTKGPLNADCALTVTLLKQNTGKILEPKAKTGELDGMYIVVQNDSADGNPNSDTTAFLADVANYGRGFNAGYEIHTAVITKPNNYPDYQVALQAAVINNHDTAVYSYGYVLNATAGNITGAILIQNQDIPGYPPGRFGFMQKFIDSSLNTKFLMPVDPVTENISIQLFDNSFGSKTLQVTSNVFNILNKAGTAEIFSLDDNGNGAFNSNLSAAATTVASLTSLSTISAVGLITPSTTAGIKGTTVADDANLGSVGEYHYNSVAGFTLTSGSNKSITSIMLSAGDWDVSGTIQFIPAATTVMYLQIGGVSPTLDTFGFLGTYFQYNNVNSAGAGSVFSTPTTRINVSTAATVYLVTRAIFTTSTCTASGLIRARRVR